MTKVCVHLSPAELEGRLVAEALRRHGLDPELRVGPPWPTHGCPTEVWVDELYADLARSIIAGPQPGTLQPDRPCPRCGAAVPPELAECWQCQALLEE